MANVCKECGKPKCGRHITAACSDGRHGTDVRLTDSVGWLYEQGCPGNINFDSSRPCSCSCHDPVITDDDVAAARDRLLRMVNEW